MKSCTSISVFNDNLIEVSHSKGIPAQTKCSNVIVIKAQEQYCDTEIPVVEVWLKHEGGVYTAEVRAIGKVNNMGALALAHYKRTKRALKPYKA